MFSTKAEVEIYEIKTQILDIATKYISWNHINPRFNTMVFLNHGLNFSVMQAIEFDLNKSLMYALQKVNT